MRKLTDFIVDKRNWILGLFIILGGVCAFLMGRVKINSDMMEYLPADSETRQGLELMTQEFGESNESSLVVMLVGLEPVEKFEMLAYFNGLKGVKAVAYDESEDYNRDEYARFELTIDGTADSETAKAVYDTVQEHFAKQEFYTSGEVENENGEVLRPWIVVVAVGSALVILIIMSGSYVEPFLFLATILLAVLLNKGTNLIFPSVSNITDSITAILQMALSMDYSIMLMNRYSQERAKEANRVKAMKAALADAFKEISSSSVTTVVGLLALVFMSFTLGRDLGFVLAKGVLFSLVAIFTCLPGLILLFDKAIQKTRKPYPHLKLNWAGKAAHKVRYLALPVFILVFGASFLLKGNLQIFYSSPLEDKVAEVFGETNQFALLYPNVDEAAVAEYCRDLQSESVVEQALCYGNTIGEDLTAEKLLARAQELGAPVELEEYLARVIYYHYYNNGEVADLTAGEFVDFVRTTVAQNPTLSQQLDAGTERQLAQLANFTSRSAVQRPRSVAELASALGVAATDVDDLLVYYNSRGITRQLTLPEFLDFMQRYVLGSKYGVSFGAAERAALGQLQVMINLLSSTQGLSAAEMAQALGIEADLVEELYLAEAALTLTPSEFLDLAVRYSTTVDAAGQPMLDAATQGLVFQAQGLQQLAQSGKRLTAAEMAELLGTTPENMRLIYSLYEIKWLGKSVQVSLQQFVDFLTTDVLQSPLYSSRFDAQMTAKIWAVQGLIAGTLRGKKYSPDELTTVFNKLGGKLDKNLVALLYLYRGSVWDYDEGWQLSLETLVNYLDETIAEDVRFEQFLTTELRAKLGDAKAKVAQAKALLVGENYARVVVETNLPEEAEETFQFIEAMEAALGERTADAYVVGNSLMAYEMSLSFNDELTLITILTMLFIFVVVAVTFRSLLIPIILVALIQCAVYFTMGAMTLMSGEMSFIAILIVQSILMGATIDYAILYTSCYIEARATLPVKSALSVAYTNSLHAIMTSGLILMLVTLIVGWFATAMTSKICSAISQGTFCAILLILLLLPAMLAAFDRWVVRRK